MKLIYTLIAFFLLSINCQSQDYPPMVVQGATWMYEKFENGPVDYFAYHIKGDTLINGVEYKILNDQGWMITVAGSATLALNSSSTPLAYLREDVSAKKVFAIIDDATQFSLCFGVSMEAFDQSHVVGENENEYLLYDFSQEVGDYIESEIPAEISDIDSSEKFGYEIRKFSLSGGQPFYEKFGSVKGLFFPHFIFFIGGADVNLIQYCVTNDYECEVLVGPLAVKDLSTTDYLIYPNPAQNTVTIKAHNEIIQSIKIYSASGKLLYFQKDIDSNEYAVDLSKLNYKGLLNIVGITENTRFVDRLIKF